MVWLPGTNLVFWFKDKASSAMLLNLSQLHPKIPICLVINFQHPSNGSICQGCPNCLWLLLTCATRAARNVALSVFSTTACTVGPWSAEHMGAGPLISRLAVVLAHEEGGARHHWKLRFTTSPTPNGLEYKMQRLWTFCLATPAPSGWLPVPVPPPPPPTCNPLSHSLNPH